MFRVTTLVMCFISYLKSIAGVFAVVTFFITMELDILFLWFGLSAAAFNIARAEIGDIELKFSIKDYMAVFLIIIMLGAVIHLVVFKKVL